MCIYILNFVNIIKCKYYKFFVAVSLHNLHFVSKFYKFFIDSLYPGASLYSI